MRREIYEAMRDVLIVIMLCLTAFFLGMTQGRNRQDKVWQNALDTELVKYHCFQKSTSDESAKSK